MLGIFMVFLSAFFYGFSNAYWKMVVADRPFLPIIFNRGIYSSSFFLICCLIDENFSVFEPWLGASPALSISHVGLSIALCLFSGMGLYFFVKSVKESDVSLVVPLSSLNVFGLLTAVLVLGETWKYVYNWAFLAVLLGLSAIFWQEMRFKSSQQLFRSLLGGLLASFFWGVSYTLFKYPIAWLGVLRFTFLLEFSVTCLVGLLLWVQGVRLEYLHQRPIQILALCLVMGSVLLHIAYQYARITQIVFAGKFQMIISLLVGRFLYREKLSFYHWLGICLLIASIYLIS